MKECLTLSELQTTVSQNKNKKSRGPGGVTHEMLTYVSNPGI